MITVVVSGGMDPVHKGHVRMFREAKALGDYLIVILNNDNWLIAKKGFAFMCEEERKEIIESIRWVDEVIITGHLPNDPDPSVCVELDIIKSRSADGLVIFANGGDRKSGNIPEYTLCDSLGIKMVFDVGGEKIQSSSDLVTKVKL